MSDVGQPAIGRGVSAPGLLAAFDAASIGLALVALDGHFLRTNSALNRMVGRDEDALYAATLADLVAPDERRDELRVVARVSGGDLEGDVADRCYLGPGGEAVWVRRGLTLVRGHGGSPLYLALHVVDVSDRIAAEVALHQSELWYRALVQHLSDLVLVTGSDDGIHYASPSVARLLGLSPEAVVGRTVTDLVHPDDYGAVASEFESRLRGGAEPVPVELRCRRGDGSWGWFEVTASRLPPTIADDWLVVNARDISDRKDAETAESAIEARFQEAFARSPIGIVFTDLGGRIVWANDALAQLLGRGADDLIGTEYSELWPDEPMTYEKARSRELLEGSIASFRYERRYAPGDGRIRWGSVYVSLVRDAEGAPHSILGQIEDITDRKIRELELQHDAEHESLTGLWNRNGFCRLLETAWRQRAGHGHLAVLFVDLDGFKHANDVYGHDAGDEVLVHAAERLRQGIRAGDAVCRWGGDEFVVLCNDVEDLADANNCAQRLCDSLGRPYRLLGGEVVIGASVGVALDTGQADPYALLREADAASYLAKRRGRNRVEHGPTG